jgi:hypothetical protein
LPESQARFFQLSSGQRVIAAIEKLV